MFRQALVRAHAEGIMQDALKKASLEVSWVDQDGLFRLGRFGSRAVGYALPDSDLDLVAEFTFKEDLLQSAWSQGQAVPIPSRRWSPPIIRGCCLLWPGTYMRTLGSLRSTVVP